MTRVEELKARHGPMRELLDRHGIAVQGTSLRCPSPGHEDHNASASLYQAADADERVHCHGCGFDEDVLGLALVLGEVGDDELRAPSPRVEWTPRGDAVAIYDYVDEEGRLLYQVCRTADKQFPQRRPDPTKASGHAWNLNGTRRVLYRLPKVLAAVEAGETVHVAEGERDVHSLEQLGLVATCNPGGAGKWRPEYGEFLRNANVVVVADRDERGRAHARQVAGSLAGIATSVSLVEPSEGKDVTDHLAAGRGMEDLVAVVAEPSEAGASSEDGAVLLGEAARFLARFVSFSSTAQRDAVALWVVHAHAVEAADTSARLAVLSPEKRSGKTRLLELLELLCPNTMLAVLPSEAIIYRGLEERQVTILLDEADAIFGKAAKDYEGLRALLNAGYRRGAVVPRCVGQGVRMRVQHFPCFAATAVAAIGDQLVLDAVAQAHGQQAAG